MCLSGSTNVIICFPCEIIIFTELVDSGITVVIMTLLHEFGHQLLFSVGCDILVDVVDQRQSHGRVVVVGHVERGFESSKAAEQEDALQFRCRVATVKEKEKKSVRL